MVTYLKSILKGSVGFYTAFFVFIWLAAWTLKAYRVADFDLDKLRDFFVWLAGFLNLKHVVDSSPWNSDKGVNPDEASKPIRHSDNG